MSELYDQCPEELDLSFNDFAMLATEYLANGGGTREEFLEWLQGLTNDEAQNILYGGTL